MKPLCDEKGIESCHQVNSKLNVVVIPTNTCVRMLSNQRFTNNLIKIGEILIALFVQYNCFNWVDQ